MSTTSSTKHPKGLYLLYATEMWERFSYYGMRALLSLYMINALFFDKASASKIYGSYTGLVWLTPLLGGYIADKYWGNRRTIIFGGALMALGQFFMFASGAAYEATETATYIMYGGLGLIIFGNGFFKPNISTMVGQLYTEGDRRVDSAFTIFYQGINVGALLAPLITGNLGERYTDSGIIIPEAFKWGYFAAGVGMIISLITFIWLKNKYVVSPTGEAVGMPPKKAEVKEIEAQEEKQSAKLSPAKLAVAGVALIGLFMLFYIPLDFDLIGAFIFSISVVLPAVILSDSSLTKIEKNRIWVIYIIAFFVIFFWMAFEQAGVSLTFFAQEQTNRDFNIFGYEWTMPASMFQSFNAAFIVLLAPLFVSIWSTLGKRGKEPSSPVKQAFGLGFLALGYLFIAWGVNGINPWDKVSIIWLMGLYLIHTIGELCLSPIGLSMVVKLAPARFVSLLMGVWFLSYSVSSKLAGELSALYPEEIKMENSVSADETIFNTVSQQAIDTMVWKQSAKEMYQLPVVDVRFEGEDKSIDSIASLNLTQAKADASVYHMKLVKISIEEREKTPVEFSGAVITADSNYLISYKEVTRITKEGEVLDKELEVWNLKPKKPSFLGMQINNLFDFFMIFVYMAGAAAILLFAINKWLLKMMHGVV